MVKKSLLASIALLSLSTVQAQQSSQVPAHCPPCPCGAGGVKGWVLIPADTNMPCLKQTGEADEETKRHSHKKEAAEPELSPERHNSPKKSLHPARTAEEERLEAELKPIAPHTYLRVNPDDPTQEKKGEWGKELNGKVYFKKLGNWVYDPSVNATTDKVKTGVKARIKALNGSLKNQKARQKPKAEVGVEPATKAEEPPIAPPPPPPASRTRKAWPKVNVPDALGTTNRPNTVYTNPTKGNEREFGLGEPNKSQTGVTGEGSSPIPPAPPPPPSGD